MSTQKYKHALYFSPKGHASLWPTSSTPTSPSSWTTPLSMRLIPLRGRELRQGPLRRHPRRRSTSVTVNNNREEKCQAEHAEAPLDVRRPGRRSRESFHKCDMRKTRGIFSNYVNRSAYSSAKPRKRELAKKSTINHLAKYLERIFDADVSSLPGSPRTRCKS